jgi:hypothetical protein
MNKPDINAQRAIIQSAISSVEEEIYTLALYGEAMKTIGLTAKAEEFGGKLADSMKLHAFYTAKLNDISVGA